MKAKSISNVTRVATTNLVSNLNAQYLNSKPSSNFVSPSSVVVNKPEYKEIITNTSFVQIGYTLRDWDKSLSIAAGPCIIFGQYGYYAQIVIDPWNSNVDLRCYTDNGGETDWRRFAFQDWVQANFVTKKELEDKLNS